MSNRAPLGEKMIVDDRARLLLHRRLVETLGQEEADILMAHLPPVGWADVATKQDLASLRIELDGRFEAVNAAIDAVRSELRGEIALLRGEVAAEIGLVRQEIGTLRGEFGTLRGEFGELRGEFGELRHGLTSLRHELRGELHLGFRNQTWLLVGTMLALVAAVIAAVALA